jgi:predicted membrane protein
MLGPTLKGDFTATSALLQKRNHYPEGVKMHPLTFAKNHPVAVVTNMALGMMVGPWIVSVVRNMTGIGVSLPSYGGSSSG